MNTYDTAKTIRDLVEYYCFRCDVGLCDCKISAMDCLKISSDRDFKEVTKPQTLADRKTENLSEYPTDSDEPQTEENCDYCKMTHKHWYEHCDVCDHKPKDEQTDCPWK